MYWRTFILLLLKNLNKMQLRTYNRTESYVPYKSTQCHDQDAPIHTLRTCLCPHISMYANSVESCLPHLYSHYIFTPHTHTTMCVRVRVVVMADTDVNRFCANTPLHLEPATAPITLPLLKAIITVNGCTITSNLQQWLQDNYTTSDIFEHICTKTNLIIDKMNLINWDNLGNALECQCLKTTVQLVKFMHNWLNTGHQKQKLWRLCRRFSSMSLCHRNMDSYLSMSTWRLHCHSNFGYHSIQVQTSQTGDCSNY
jgi:hypothetical protein